MATKVPLALVELLLGPDISASHSGLQPASDNQRRVLTALRIGAEIVYSFMKLALALVELLL